jgi:hypothetical protein
MVAFGPAAWFAVWVRGGHQHWRLLQIGGTVFPRVRHAATGTYEAVGKVDCGGI